MFLYRSKTFPNLLLKRKELSSFYRFKTVLNSVVKIELVGSEVLAIVFSVDPLFVQFILVQPFFVQSISSNPIRLGQDCTKWIGRNGLDENRLDQNELDEKQVYQFFLSVVKNGNHYSKNTTKTLLNSLITKKKYQNQIYKQAQKLPFYSGAVYRNQIVDINVSNIFSD